MSDQVERGWKGGEVEDDPSWLVHTPDGRTFHEADVSTTEDQYRQMWNGHTCAWCGEPWPEQWPERCTLVGCWSPDSMTEEAQRRYLHERFGGEKWFGPSKATIANWQNAADVPEKKIQIWLPRGV